VEPIRRGLDEARGAIVAFVDDDAEPDPGWFEALLSPFSDTRVACVGGRVVTAMSPSRVHADAGQIRWYGRHIGNVGSVDGVHPFEVHSVMECNWAWRADVLRSLDFDPVLSHDDASMYGLDLCLQAGERGFRVLYEPRARVFHHAAPRDPALDRADRVRRTVTYSRNYTYIALKHLHGVRRAAFLCWWFLVGERGSYGIAKAVADVLLRGWRVVPLIMASLRGRWQGVGAWLALGR
jgi:GT2 family glycosyltransferase